MVWAQYNPSTGKASRTSATGLQQVVSAFAPIDCCCFLNPNADPWSAIVTYDKDDEVGSSGFVYRSLADNNLNNPPYNPNAWAKSSDQECGSLDWDSSPPYGGVGKTPQTYTLTIANARVTPTSTCGNTKPSKINGTHVLQYEGACLWKGIIIDGAETCSLPVEINLRFNAFFGRIAVGLTGDIPYFAFLPLCDIEGTIAVTPSPNGTFTWDPGG
jgi:hypothetical protein